MPEFTETQKQLLSPAVQKFMASKQELQERLGLIHEGFLDGRCEADFNRWIWQELTPPEAPPEMVDVQDE